MTLDALDLVHLIMVVKRDHLEALELNETGHKEFEKQMDIALQVMIIYSTSFSTDFGYDNHIFFLQTMRSASGVTPKEILDLNLKAFKIYESLLFANHSNFDLDITTSFNSSSFSTLDVQMKWRNYFIQSAN